MEMYTKEYIKEKLTSSLGVVTFTKANGEEREMTCTLLESYLPKAVESVTGFVGSLIKASKAESPDSIAVWDINKDSWRSFRIDSVIRFQVIGESVCAPIVPIVPMDSFENYNTFGAANVSELFEDIQTHWREVRDGWIDTSAPVGREFGASPWVYLTDDEIEEILYACEGVKMNNELLKNLIKLIEVEMRDKNGTNYEY